MLRILFLIAALLYSAVMSSCQAGNGERLQGGQENMLGISLPDGFETTREVAEAITVLHVYCGPSYEKFDFKNSPAPPGEVMEAVLARLVDSGYRVQWIFDQFLEYEGIVIVTIFSPTGEEAYYLLFDYDRRLFHPVGPCPARP